MGKMRCHGKLQFFKNRYTRVVFFLKIKSSWFLKFELKIYTNNSESGQPNTLMIRYVVNNYLFYRYKYLMTIGNALKNLETYNT